MRYLSLPQTLNIALFYFFDNKNKHLVVCDLSYGHSDSVTYGKVSHPTDAFIQKCLMIPLHNLCFD